MLALLIGVVTVVIGCWLSDNCWSPEPEHVITVAWPPANPTPPPPLSPISIVSVSSSTSRPSTPHSDFPLVELSDTDSMNLWHHVCEVEDTEEIMSDFIHFCEGLGRNFEMTNYYPYMETNHICNNNTFSIDMGD